MRLLNRLRYRTLILRSGLDGRPRPLGHELEQILYDIHWRSSEIPIEEILERFGKAVENLSPKDIEYLSFQLHNIIGDEAKLLRFVLAREYPSAQFVYEALDDDFLSEAMIQSGKLGDYRYILEEAYLRLVKEPWEKDGLFSAKAVNIAKMVRALGADGWGQDVMKRARKDGEALATTGVQNETIYCAIPFIKDRELRSRIAQTVEREQGEHFLTVWAMVCLGDDLAAEMGQRFAERPGALEGAIDHTVRGLGVYLLANEGIARLQNLEKWLPSHPWQVWELPVLFEAIRQKSDMTGLMYLTMCEGPYQLRLDNGSPRNCLNLLGVDEKTCRLTSKSHLVRLLASGDQSLKQLAFRQLKHVVETPEDNSGRQR